MLEKGSDQFQVVGRTSNTTAPKCPPHLVRLAFNYQPPAYLLDGPRNGKAWDGFERFRNNHE
jgi:hypothetical protein